LRRRTAVRRAALALAATIGVAGPSLVLSTAPAGAATTVRVLTCAGSPKKQPAGYVLSCADANSKLSGMTWTAWGPQQAVGHGVLVYDSCQPSCAAGSPVRRSAAVRLTTVRRSTAYGNLFTRAVVTVTKPVNGAYRITFTLPTKQL
jgi:hypothetical protein